jgi:hypothetical protein
MSGFDNTSYTVRSSTAAAITVTANDYFILLTPGAATAVTLPNAATIQPGREYVIYKTAAAFTVTITPAVGTVDGGANTTLISGQIHAKTFTSDGTNWFITSEYDSVAA